MIGRSKRGIRIAVLIPFFLGGPSGLLGSTYLWISAHDAMQTLKMLRYWHRWSNFAEKVWKRVVKSLIMHDKGGRITSVPVQKKQVLLGFLRIYIHIRIFFFLPSKSFAISTKVLYIQMKIGAIVYPQVVIGTPSITGVIWSIAANTI